jgi:hypothetical protein
MSKSQVRTLICVLCMAALLVSFAGCLKETAKESQMTDEPAKMASAEMPKEAKPAAAKPAPAPSSAKGLGPYKLVSNWMDEPGFIADWLMVGPFPNPGERPDNAGFGIDYLKDCGGELECVPANGMEVKDPNGKVFKWQQYRSTSPEINFFSVEGLNLEPSQEDILVYCACWLDSDAEKDVELRVGSDDGYKLWLNHKLIGEQNVYRSMELDSETYKVKLNKGKNLILIKVTQDWGEFQFELRVVNADGKEVPGITVWD